MSDFTNTEIEEVRAMTNDELEAEGWEGAFVPPIVFVLEDGTKLYPSQDPEGNGPGCMFGERDDGERIRVHPK